MKKNKQRINEVTLIVLIYVQLGFQKERKEDKGGQKKYLKK